MTRWCQRARLRTSQVDFFKGWGTCQHAPKKPQKLYDRAEPKTAQFELFLPTSGQVCTLQHNSKDGLVWFQVKRRPTLSNFPVNNGLNYKGEMIKG